MLVNAMLPQVSWQDDIDPDTMTYEVRSSFFILFDGDGQERQWIRRDKIKAVWFVDQELVELGEAVGTESRGLSQELIETLPTRKYKFGSIFSRKRAGER